MDDIHFLKQRTTSVEISNQFKYISNEFPLTIVFIGIDLRQRGFYSDGGCFEGILGQSGRRITPLKLRDFSLDEAHRHEWRQLLLAIERLPTVVLVLHGYPDLHAAQSEIVGDSARRRQHRGRAERLW